MNIELHKLVKETRMVYSIKGFTEVQSYDNDVRVCSEQVSDRMENGYKCCSSMVAQWHNSEVFLNLFSCTHPQ